MRDNLKLKKNRKAYVVLRLMFINFLFFYPMIFNYTLSSLQNIIIILLISYCSYLIVLYISKRKISKLFLILLIFEIWMLVTTLLNSDVSDGYDYVIWFRNTLIVLGLTIYIEKESKRNPKELLSSLYIIFSIYVYINLILIFLYPEGLFTKVSLYSENTYFFNLEDAYYFIGHKNNAVLVFMPAIIISTLYYYLNDKRIYPHIVLFFSIIYQTIHLESATNTVGCSLLIIYFILLNIIKAKNIMKLLTFNKLSIVYIFIFLSIVVFKVQDTFAFLIEEILNKSLTFTGRTEIWDNAVMFIKESPFYGYGTHDGGNIIFYKFRDWYAHNYIYDLLVQGGSIALLIILSFLYQISKKLKECKNIFATRIISWGGFCLGIISLTESYYNFSSFTLIFLIAYNIDNFSNVYYRRTI